MSVEIQMDVGEVSARDGSIDLSIIAVLRTQIEENQRSIWRCVGDLNPEFCGRVQHLAPPVSGGGNGGDSWRANHRVGGCYYRVGPSFSIIRERRVGYEPSVFKLRDPELLACVQSLLVPSNAHACEACLVLDDYGLAIGDDAGRVFLPTRLKFPPVPFLAV